MALVLDYIDPDTGAKGDYFRILRIVGVCAPNEIDLRWEVWVGMFASQDLRARNAPPLRQYQINIPWKDLTVDPREGAMPGFYSALKNYAPFAGQAVTDVIDDSDNISLDAAKAIKYGEINSARLAANLSTFPYKDKLIDCDQLSRSDIDGTANQIALSGTFPEGFPNAWKTADDSYIPIPDIATFKDMYNAMTSQGSANFAHAQKLKSLVANCGTVDAVRAITWSTDTSMMASAVCESTATGTLS